MSLVVIVTIFCMDVMRRSFHAVEGKPCEKKDLYEPMKILPLCHPWAKSLALISPGRWSWSHCACV